MKFKKLAYIKYWKKNTAESHSFMKWRHMTLVLFLNKGKINQYSYKMQT